MRRHFRALLLLAMTACNRCDEPSPPMATAPVQTPPSSAPASQPTNEATVLAQRGKVEVQRGQGEWQPLNVGDRLKVTDAVRTDEEGSVDLAVNETRLRIHERSEFTVKKLSDSVLRGRLTGRMESEVTAGKGEVEVEAAGTDAVVRTSGGHFSMISNGRGVVAVANITGAVNVTANAKTVSLNAGEVAHIRGNGKIDKPSKALRNVLLSVAWPDAKITNRKTIPVTGKVEVGSRVVIQGKHIEPDVNGVFTAQVELKPGSQQLAVMAVDVLGRKKAATTSITHDAKAPNVKVKGKLWD